MLTDKNVKCVDFGNENLKTLYIHKIKKLKETKSLLG